jgi:hypothetical protein
VGITYCSGTPYYPQRVSTDPWVSKSSAHKLFGEMPTSNWRSPSRVLEVTIRQELQSRLVPETRLDVFVEYELGNTQDGKSVLPGWLPARLLAMDDVPKSADSALSSLRHDQLEVTKPCPRNHCMLGASVKVGSGDTS